MICVLWAPETLGKTLEDIDGVWEERMYKTRNLLKLGIGRERRDDQPHQFVELEPATRA